MPDAILVQAAAAVTSALNAAPAGVFSQKFEAERSYADWELPLEDMADPDNSVKVDVVPVPPMEAALDTQFSIAYKPAVDIIIRRRLDPSQRDANSKLLLPELDALVLLVQQIAEYFVRARLQGPLADCQWEELEVRRSFVPVHLRTNHQFTGVIRLMFNASRSLPATP